MANFWEDLFFGKGTKKTTEAPAKVAPSTGSPTSLWNTSKPVTAAPDAQQKAISSWQMQTYHPEVAANKLAGIRDTADQHYRQIGARPGSDAYSTAEYATLSPRQQAVVQAQSQLWDAIQADKGAAETAGVKKTTAALSNAAYSKSVGDLFTDKGGSDTYAPRTVALLKELGITDKGGDLDNYLNGSALLDKRAISGITDETAATKGDGLYNVDAALVRGTQSSDIASLLSAGTSLLQGVQQQKGYDYAQGLMPPRAVDPLSGLDNTSRQNLQNLVVGMANKSTPSDLGTYYNSLKGTIDPALITTFIRSSLDDWKAGNLSLGTGAISPEEFAQKWGLN